eukprot:TRINITY_DN3960_c0_g2_i1.p1 TRINITY_DN3960_c0_g2~~TRINITY_DN3960_c0_g2_i1.p1  ORF type:complete len:443 (+),score=105.33 TRINITY_DN3960_c0_g2_i1:53-1381(+)
MSTANRTDSGDSDNDGESYVNVQVIHKSRSHAESRSDQSDIMSYRDGELGSSVGAYETPMTGDHEVDPTQKKKSKKLRFLKFGKKKKDTTNQSPQGADQGVHHDHVSETHSNYGEDPSHHHDSRTKGASGLEEDKGRKHSILQIAYPRLGLSKSKSKKGDKGVDGDHPIPLETTSDVKVVTSPQQNPKAQTTSVVPVLKEDFSKPVPISKKQTPTPLPEVPVEYASVNSEHSIESMQLGSYKPEIEQPETPIGKRASDLSGDLGVVELDTWNEENAQSTDEENDELHRESKTRAQLLAEHGAFFHDQIKIQMADLAKTMGQLESSTEGLKATSEIAEGNAEALVGVKECVTKLQATIDVISKQQSELNKRVGVLKAAIENAMEANPKLIMAVEANMNQINDEVKELNKRHEKVNSTDLIAESLNGYLSLSFISFTFPPFLKS